MAVRAVTYVVNTCFRRGYTVNVLRYKIGAGVTAVLPFADQLPRYLARDHIRKTFGVDDKDKGSFRHYLKELNLTISDGYLKTSTFKECVAVIDRAVWSGPIEMIFDFFIKSFFKENGLVWGLLNEEFEALSIDNIFELNDGWSGLERILLISLNDVGISS